MLLVAPHIYICPGKRRRGIFGFLSGSVRIPGPLAASKFAFSSSLAISEAPGPVMQRCVARLARFSPLHGLQVASRGDFGFDFGPKTVHFGLRFLAFQRCPYFFVFLSVFRLFFSLQCRFW